MTLFSTGVPGLSIPGQASPHNTESFHVDVTYSILEIGPVFKITASTSGDLEVQADLAVQLAYNVQGATASFPPGTGLAANADPKPDDTR